MSSLEVPNRELHVDTPRRDGSTPTRRDLLAGTVGLFAGSSLFPTPALAADSLSQRLERRDLNKPVFNKARPGPQQYPDWMEGTWSATADFQGYSFPSKTMNPKLLVKEPTVPGFQKLSVVYIPDIGSTQVRYEMRFGRKEPGGPVLEDRAFNLRSVVDGYLNQGVGPTMIKRAVEDVEYDPMTDPNRNDGASGARASVNAERIELFANARERAATLRRHLLLLRGDATGDARVRSRVRTGARDQHGLHARVEFHA